MTKVNKRQKIIFGGLNIIWNYNRTSISQTWMYSFLQDSDLLKKFTQEAFNIKKKKKKESLISWTPSFQTHTTPALRPTWLLFLLYDLKPPDYHIICLYMSSGLYSRVFSSESYILATLLKNKIKHGFPGGPIVKNSPCNAGDMGSILCAGKSHRLQGN